MRWRGRNSGVEGQGEEEGAKTHSSHGSRWVEVFFTERESFGEDTEGQRELLVNLMGLDANILDAFCLS